MMSPQDAPREEAPDVDQAPSLEAFLREMRALRERHGLSIADLAQRTHYPAQTIKAAERGPGRPTLPIVEAYVRACGEEPGTWEDQWRALPEDATITRSTITRFSGRPSLPKLALAAGLVVVAAGGSTLLALQPASHEAATGASGGLKGHAPASVPVAAAPLPPPPATPSTRPSQQRSPAPAHQVPASPVATGTQTATPMATAPMATPPMATMPPGTGSVATTSMVTGPGCPQGPGDGITVDNAPTGPGWTTAGDGWTGNGCDGSSDWTMDPGGNQADPSTITWFFAPATTATSCTVAVFVPAQNAQGVADYAISTGTTATATVAVDQSSAAGQWVTLGSYQVNGGPLAIEISPDPTTLTASNKGKGRNNAIAASATSATCG